MQLQVHNGHALARGVLPSYHPCGPRSNRTRRRNLLCTNFGYAHYGHAYYGYMLTKAHSPPLPGPLHAPVALGGQPLLGGAACSKCPSTTNNNNYYNCCCCGLSLLAATHGLADSPHRSRRPPTFAQGHSTSIALVPARMPNVASAASASEIHALLPLTRALTIYRRRAAAAARGGARPRPLHLATLVIRGTVTAKALGGWLECGGSTEAVQVPRG